MGDEALGEFVANKRAELGLTQSQLSAAIGMSHSAIGHVESGARNIGVEAMDRLADVLELSPAERIHLAGLRQKASGVLGVNDVKARLASVEGQLRELASMVEELMLRTAPAGGSGQRARAARPPSTAAPDPRATPPAPSTGEA